MLANVWLQLSLDSLPLILGACGASATIVHLHLWSLLKVALDIPAAHLWLPARMYMV